MIHINYTPTTSPWGPVGFASVLAPGILYVRCPFHQGLYLDLAHTRVMRSLFLPTFPVFSTPWYSMDRLWALPFTVFASQITDYLCQPHQSADCNALSRTFHDAQVLCETQFPGAIALFRASKNRSFNPYGTETSP